MRFFLLIINVLLISTLYASSITLRSESNSVAAGEQFSIALIVDEDSNEEISEIIEPDFKNFDLENRGESTSSSFNMVNGKISYKKQKTFTYILRALKEGEYQIGPAGLKLESGKVIRSNKISLIVAGGSVQPPKPSGNTGNSPQTEEESEPKSIESSDSLSAPLNSWEKRTDPFFIRTVVEPSGEIYKGEPVVVSYYLFTRSSISDVNFYKMPAIEKAWSEELESPKNLRFSRVVIDQTPYDFAPLKKYLIIPENSATTISTTQMILDISTGGFFNMRKKNISSIALNIPLKELPDYTQHNGGFFGDFTILTDKEKVELKEGKLLDTVTYTLSGCGNIQAIDLKLPEIKGLKIFPPDVKTEPGIRNGQYCGTKSFKFMLKGLEKGEFQIPEISFDTYSREKGWQKLTTKPLSISVINVSESDGLSDKQKNSAQFEFLTSLPSGTKEHNLTPVTESLWFQILMAIPFGAFFISFLCWFIREIRRKQVAGSSYKSKEWEEKINKSEDIATLINNFYDGLSEIYGLQLRGERSKEIDRKYGEKIETVTAFVKELQYAAYSQQTASNFEQLRKKAVELFRKTGEKQ